jgi:P27 family predicted phage terminase small subunit
MPAGRRPKPLEMKIVTGNPGKRKLNRQEPKFSGKPNAPSWMPKEAKVEWKRVVDLLDDLDMLKGTDQAALAAYAVSYARWVSAEKIVDAEGQTVQEPIVNKAGEVVGTKTRRHPATIVAKDERQSMQRACSSFGFDPSSRSRVQMPEKKEKQVEENYEDSLYASPEKGNTGRSIH